MFVQLMEKVIALLKSGDDTGCSDGLVVVGRDEFMDLRKLVADQTGEVCGSVDEE